MKKIVIIEDEPRTRETYKHLLAQNFTELEVAGEAGTVSSAVALIREVNPDIVLMDIELEDGNSFQLLQHLRPYNFKIIFPSPKYNVYIVCLIRYICQYSFCKKRYFVTNFIDMFFL